MKPLGRLGSGLILSVVVLAVAGACTSGAVDNGDSGASGASAALPGAGGPSAGAPGVGSAGSAPGSTAGSSSGASAVTSNAGSTSGGAASNNGGAGTTTTSGGSTGSAGAASAACTNTPPNNGDTCAHAAEYGWCSQSWLGSSCQQSCGKCSGGAGGSTGSSGAAGSNGSTGSAGAAQGAAGAPPVLTGGSNGWATRYWDCCKPACGWKGNVPSNSNPVSSCSVSNQSFGSNYDEASACPNGSNGPAFMCQNFGPWAVSDTLAYGFAAVNKGSDYCGKCYQLQFSGTSHNASNDTGSQALSGKTMIVQAINNGGVDGNQFDLLIPGGGVGDYNACATQWGTSSLGEQYGGFFLACQKANGYDYTKSRACAASKCQSVFSSKPDLLASCNWFVNWFGAPDNPALMYKEVTCPAAITALSGLHR